LVAHGVRPGDRVGLYLDHAGWVDHAIAYLGTIKAAAVAVPLSGRFAPPEPLTVLDQAGACGIVTGPVRWSVICSARCPGKMRSRVCTAVDGQPL
jgi:acyl-CoA synthetase (AMP-forming)/AMP-acid ligase II